MQPNPTRLWDRLKIGGHAASGISGNESLAGWNFRPWSEPNVPL